MQFEKKIKNKLMGQNIENHVEVNLETDTGW